MLPVINNDITEFVRWLKSNVLNMIKINSSSMDYICKGKDVVLKATPSFLH